MFLKKFCVSAVQKEFSTTYSKLTQLAILSRNYSIGESDKHDAIKTKVEKLLDISSPLKSELWTDTEWATTGYPEGTHFNKNRQSIHSLRPRGDPTETSVILFPGQGSQFVGMGRELLRYPLVKDMYAAASEVLGYDLLQLCLQGPAEKLNRTEYCQPAVMVTSLASLERLKEEQPEAVNGCVATAGFSVGEISSLVFAGCLNFERGLKLVKVRAEAMQLCSEVVPSGMMTVMVGADSTLSQACNDAKQHCTSLGIEWPVCVIANYLSPGLKVIAGHTHALNFITEHAVTYKLRKLSRLPVSGAFHTELMRPAAEAVRSVLKKLELRDPLICVHSNTDGKRYANAEQVLRKLPRQVYTAVRWEQILHILYARPPGEDFPHTFECGPGQSLKTILKKVNAKAHSSCYSVFV